MSKYTTVGISIWISAIYYRATVFICPACHTIFRPRFFHALTARHTPYALPHLPHLRS